MFVEIMWNDPITLKSKSLSLLTIQDNLASSPSITFTGDSGVVNFGAAVTSSSGGPALKRFLLVNLLGGRGGGGEKRRKTKFKIYYLFSSVRIILAVCL